MEKVPTETLLDATEHNDSPGESSKQTLKGRFRAFLRNAHLRTFAIPLSFHRDPHAKKEGEPKKVVIAQDRFTALIRSWVHLLPLLGTCAIAALHFNGYFIGASYQGLADPAWQTFDQLCLQIAGKLMEILILASLSVILMDVLRHVLLFRDKGLPMGILSASKDYTELSYFISPEFFFGCRGFKSIRLGVAFAVMLIISGIIAVLAGPASSTLLIPVIRYDWSGGGADFYLNGSNSDLWPSSLDGRHVGSSDCLNPSSSLAALETLNTSDCVWNGYSALASFFKGAHLNDGFGNVTVNDGAIQRIHQFRPSGTPNWQETWALGSNVPVGLVSSNLADIWTTSLQYYDKDKMGLSRTHIDRRINSATASSVTSQLPAVRVSCGSYNDVLINGTTQYFGYPFLPLYNITQGLYNMSFSYSDSDSPGSNDSVKTQWMKWPAGTALNMTDGSTTTDAPSAFLNVIVPYIGNETFGAFYACSIDARWAPGLNIGLHIGDDTTIGAKFLQYGQFTDLRPAIINDTDGIGFRPNNDGKWQTVDLQLDWLNALTPYFDDPTNTSAPDPNAYSQPVYTTLSDILHAVGADNSTGSITDWYNSRSPIESIIAVDVVDGMSRTGFSTNGGTNTFWQDSGTAGANNHITYDNSTYDALIRGEAVWKPAPSVSQPLTKFRWDVTVAGYSYKADSITYYLSLLILLFHAVCALAHTAWRVCIGRSSDVWESSAELVVLAQQSAPAKRMLKNTCAGIDKGRTFATGVRLRAVDRKFGEELRERNTAREDLQLIFGEDDDEDDVFEKVKVDRAYGSE